MMKSVVGGPNDLAIALVQDDACGGAVQRFVLSCGPELEALLDGVVFGFFADLSCSSSHSVTSFRLPRNGVLVHVHTHRGKCIIRVSIYITR